MNFGAYPTMLVSLPLAGRTLPLRQTSCIQLTAFFLGAGWALIGCTSEVNYAVVTDTEKPGASGDQLDADDPNEEPFVYYDLFLLNEDGEPIRQLTNTPGEEANPAVSGDGRFIAFDFGRAIYVLDTETGTQKAITEPLVRTAHSPAWNPKTDQIAFVGAPFPSEDILPAWDIYLTGLNGDDLKNLTDTPQQREHSPAWSSDGALLAFVAEPVGEVFTRSMESGETKSFHPPVTNEHQLPTHVVWRDRTALLVCMSSRASNVLLELDTATGKSRVVSEDPSYRYARFSPVLTKDTLLIAQARNPLAANVRLPDGLRIQHFPLEVEFAVPCSNDILVTRAHQVERTRESAIQMSGVTVILQTGGTLSYSDPLDLHAPVVLEVEEESGVRRYRDLTFEEAKQILMERNLGQVMDVERLYGVNEEH
jgi:hypothetical protein